MVKIRNIADFKTWLDGKPAVFAQTMAIRIVLRTMPLNSIPERLDWMQTLWRASVISWASRNYPTYEMGNAAYAAANAVGYGSRAIADGSRSAVYAAAKAAANADVAAYVAADATDAVVSATSDAAARAAARAGRAAANAIISASRTSYATINADANRLEDLSLGRTPEAATLALIAQPLWPVSIPSYLKEAWQLRQSELKQWGGDWDIWIDWYEQRLNGSNIAFSRLQIPYDDVTAAIAVESEAFWDRPPAEVNAEIKARLDAGQPPELPQDLSGIIFTTDMDRPVDLAALPDNQRLLDTPSCRNEFNEFLEAFALLSVHSQNELGPITELVGRLKEIIGDGILNGINSHRFWSSGNRLRKALRKHASATQSPDFSYDRLDGAVAADLEDVVENLNHVFAGQPILAAKEVVAAGPQNPDALRLVTKNLHPFLATTSEDRDLTTAAAGAEIKEASEDVVTAGTAPTETLGQVAGKTTVLNYTLAHLKKAWDFCKKPFLEGAVKELAVQTFKAIVENTGPIIEFIKFNAKSLLGASEHILAVIRALLNSL